MIYAVAHALQSNGVDSLSVEHNALTLRTAEIT